MDGKTFLGRQRWVTLTNLTSQAKYTAVKPAATQGQVTVAGVGDPIVGVLAEAIDAVSVARQVRIIEAIPGAVLPCLAAGDISRQTSSLPTRVVAAASGKVQALPTTVGTHYVLGQMDIDTPASTTDAGGDIVHVLVQPETVEIPSDRVVMHVGPLADQGTNATVTVKLGCAATGRQRVPLRLQVLSGTTADATAQLKFAGTGACAAFALDGDAETTTFSDTSAAAGQAITVDLVTAASTGDLDAAVVIFEFADLPA